MKFRSTLLTALVCFTVPMSIAHAAAEHPRADRLSIVHNSGVIEVRYAAPLPAGTVACEVLADTDTAASGAAAVTCDPTQDFTHFDAAPQAGETARYKLRFHNGAAEHSETLWRTTVVPDRAPPLLVNPGLPQYAPLLPGAQVELRPTVSDDIGVTLVELFVDNVIHSTALPGGDSNDQSVFIYDVPLDLPQVSFHYRLHDAAGNVTTTAPEPPRVIDLPPAAAVPAPECPVLAPGDVHVFDLGTLVDDDIDADSALSWHLSGLADITAVRSGTQLTITAPPHPISEMLAIVATDRSGNASPVFNLNIEVVDPTSGCPTEPPASDIAHVGSGQTYSTLAAALATTKPWIVVHAGSYGTATISRAVTVTAACTGNGVYDLVTFSASYAGQYAIDIDADDVTLRGVIVQKALSANLRINGASNVTASRITSNSAWSDGIRITNSPGALLEDSLSEGASSNGIEMSGSNNVTIARTESRNNNGHGLYISSGTGIVVKDSHIHHNSNSGMKIISASSADLRGNLLNDNTPDNVLLGAVTGGITLFGNTIRGSNTGVTMSGSAVDFTNNFFDDNFTQIRINSGTGVTITNNRFHDAFTYAIELNDATVIDRISDNLFEASYGAVFAESSVSALYFDYNAYWGITLQAVGLTAGANKVTADPLIDAAGYLDPLSPLADAGSRSAADAGVESLYTLSDGFADVGTVDIGFHHAAPPEGCACGGGGSAPPIAAPTLTWESAPPSTPVQPGQFLVLADFAAGSAPLATYAISPAFTEQAVSATNDVPLTFDLLEHGAMPIVVVLTDTAGNQATLSARVDVDAHPPLIRVVAPSAHNAATVLIDGAYTDLNPGTAAPTLPGNFTLTNAQESFNFSAQDAAGNSSARTHDISFDTTAPTPYLVAPTTAFAEGRPLIEIDADDTTLVAQFRLDGVDYAALTSLHEDTPIPRVHFRPDDDLTEGAHTLEVELKDAPGNSTGLQSYTITRDSTPPEVTVPFGAHPSGTWRGNPAQRVQGVDPPPYYGAAVAITVSVSDVSSGPAPGIYLNGAVINSGDLVSAEGNHTLVVHAYDAVGQDTRVELSFAVDLTPPAMTITGLTDGAVYQSPPTIDVQLSDLTPSTWTQSPAAGALPSAEGGPYTVTITADDSAGNQSVEQRSYYIDTTAPAPEWVVPAPGLTLVDSSFTPQVSVTGESHGYTVEFTPAGLIDYEGPLTLSATVTDAAGNQTTIDRTLTVDLLAPLVVVTSPQPSTGGWFLPPVNAAANVIDETTSTVVFDPPGPYTVPGAHNITARAVDQVGRITEVPIDFNIDVQRPLLLVTDPPAGASLSASPALIAGQIEDEAPTTLTVNGQSITVAPDGSFSGQLALTPGSNSLQFAVTDAAGNQTEHTREVTLTEGALLIAFTSDSEVVSPHYTLTGTVTYPAGPEPEVLVGTTRVPLTGNAFSSEHTLQPGLNIFQLTASPDQGPDAKATHSVFYDDAVDRGEGKLTIIDPAPSSVIQSSELTVTGSYEGFGAAPPITVNGNAATVQGGRFTAKLTFSPSDEGLFDIVAAIPGTDANDVTQIIVDNTGPSLTAQWTDASGSSHPITEGDTIDITWTPLTLSGTAVDPTLAGVHVNDAPALVLGGEWAHAFTANTGSQPLTVTASDVAGRTATLSFTVNLAADAPTVEFLAPKDGAIVDTGPIITVVDTSMPAGSPHSVTQLTINGINAIPVSPPGRYFFPLPLPASSGPMAIEAIATTTAGTTARELVHITYQDPATLPIEVTGMDPPAGSINVDPLSLITLSFNRALPDDVNPAFARVEDAAGAPIPGSFTVLPGALGVTFTPSTPLPRGSSLKVSVHSSFSDLPDLDWQATFETAPPVTALTGTLTDDIGRPLSDIKLELADQTTVSDAAGYFQFVEPSLGVHQLTIHESESHIGAVVGVVVEAEQVSRMHPITLTRFAPADRRPVDESTGELVFESLALLVDLSDATLHFPDGTNRGELRLARLDPERGNPYPVEFDAQPLALYAVGPLSHRVVGSVRAILPNVFQRHEGEKLVALALDPSDYVLRPAGTATVTPIGIETDSNFTPESLELLGYLPLDAEQEEVLRELFGPGTGHEPTPSPSPSPSPTPEQGNLWPLLHELFLREAHAQVSGFAEGRRIEGLVGSTTRPVETFISGRVHSCTPRSDAESQSPVQLPHPTSGQLYTPASNLRCVEQVTENGAQQVPSQTPSPCGDEAGTECRFDADAPFFFPRNPVFGPTNSGLGTFFQAQSQAPGWTDNLGRYRYRFLRSTSSATTGVFAPATPSRMTVEIRSFGVCSSENPAKCRAQTDLNVASLGAEHSVQTRRIAPGAGAAGADRAITLSSDLFSQAAGGRAEVDIRVPLNTVRGTVRLRGRDGNPLALKHSDAAAIDGACFYNPCEAIWNVDASRSESAPPACTYPPEFDTPESAGLDAILQSERARLHQSNLDPRLNPAMLPMRSDRDDDTGDIKSSGTEGIALEDLCRTDVYVFTDDFRHPVTAVARARRAVGVGSEDATLHFRMPVLAPTGRIRHRVRALVRDRAQCNLNSSVEIERIETAAGERFLCDVVEDVKLEDGTSPFTIKPGSTLHVVAVNRATGHTGYAQDFIVSSQGEDATQGNVFSFDVDLEVDAFPPHIETWVERHAKELATSTGAEDRLELRRRAKNRRDALHVHRGAPLLGDDDAVARQLTDGISITTDWRIRVAPKGTLAAPVFKGLPEAPVQIDVTLCGTQITRDADGSVNANQQTVCSSTPTTFESRGHRYIWAPLTALDSVADPGAVFTQYWLQTSPPVPTAVVAAGDVEATSLIEFPTVDGEAIDVQPFTGRHMAVSAGGDSHTGEQVALFTVPPGRNVTTVVSGDGLQSKHYYLHVVDGLDFFGQFRLSEDPRLGVRPWRAIPLETASLSGNSPEPEQTFDVSFERKNELHYVVFDAHVSQLSTSNDRRTTGTRERRDLGNGAQPDFAMGGETDFLFLLQADAPLQPPLSGEDAAASDQWTVRLGDGRSATIQLDQSGGSGTATVEITTEDGEDVSFEDYATLALLLGKSPEDVAWRMRAPLRPQDIVLDPLAHKHESGAMPGELKLRLDAPGTVEVFIDGELTWPKQIAHPWQSIGDVPPGGRYVRIPMGSGTPVGRDTSIRVRHTATANGARHDLIDVPDARGSKRYLNADLPGVEYLHDVSLADGHLQLERPLFEVPTARGPFGFSLRYSNIDERTGGDLGSGWSHSAEVALWLRRESIVVLTEDGRGHKFTLSGQAWQPTAGEFGTLTEEDNLEAAASASDYITVELTPYHYASPVTELINYDSGASPLRFSDPTDQSKTLVESRLALDAAELDAPGLLTVQPTDLLASHPQSFEVPAQACIGAGTQYAPGPARNRYLHADPHGRYRIKRSDVRYVEGTPWLLANAGAKLRPRRFRYTSNFGEQYLFDVPSPRNPDQLLVRRTGNLQDDNAQTRWQYDAAGRLQRIYSTDKRYALQLCWNYALRRPQVDKIRLLERDGSAPIADFEQPDPGKRIREVFLGYDPTRLLLTSVFDGSFLIPTDGSGNPNLANLEISGSPALWNEAFEYEPSYADDLSRRNNIVERTDPNGQLTKYTYAGAAASGAQNFPDLPHFRDRVEQVALQRHDSSEFSTIRLAWSYQQSSATTPHTSVAAKVTVTDGEGTARTHTLNAYGQIIETQYRSLGLTSYKADSSYLLDRTLASATDLDAVDWSWKFEHGRMTEQTRAGLTTKYTWGCTEDGQVASVLQVDLPGGPVETLSRDCSSGRLLSRQNGIETLESYSFDAANGRLTSMTDARGVQQTLSAHDVFGNPTQATAGTFTWAWKYDHLSRLRRASVSHGGHTSETTWGYYPGGQLAYEDDPTGRKLQVLDLDARANPSVVSEASQATGGTLRTTTFTYDQEGRVTRTDRTQAGTSTVERYTLDGLGRTTHVYRGSAPGTLVATYAYPSAPTTVTSRPATFTNVYGGVHDYDYDSHGRLECERLPTKTVDANTRDEIRYFFNPRGLLHKVRDPRGVETEYTYDGLSRVTKVEVLGEGGGSVEYTDFHGASAEAQTLRYPEQGVRREIELDTLGRTKHDKMYPLSTGTLLGGLVLASWVNLFGPTSYTYDQTTGQVGGQLELDGRGRVTRHTIGGQSHSDGIFEWSYSPLGQLSTLRQPGNALHRFEYDPDDRLVCQFDPEDRRSDYHYDDVGRLTGIDENQTRVWSHNFHSGLRTIGDTTLPDSNELSYTLELDELGRPALARQEDLQLQSWKYQADFVSEVTDVLGVKRTFDVDAQGRVTRTGRISAADPTHTVTDLLIDWPGTTPQPQPQDAGWATARATYQDPLSLSVDTAGRTLDYNLDIKGRTTSRTGAGTRSFSYGPLGNLEQIGGPRLGTVGITPDARGYPNQITARQGITQLTHDKSGFLSSIKRPHAPQVTLQPEPGRARIQAATVDNTQYDYSYDSQSRLRGVDRSGFSMWRMQYDPYGRLQQRSYGLYSGESFDHTELFSARRFSRTAGGITQTYQLDGFGQLASVSALGDTLDRSRDPWGRTDDAEGGFDANGRGLQHDIDDSGRLLTLRVDQGGLLRDLAFSYDDPSLAPADDPQLLMSASDETVADNGYSMAWNAQGQLQSVTLSSGPSRVWCYDAQNRLASVYVIDAPLVDCAQLHPAHAQVRHAHELSYDDASGSGRIATMTRHTATGTVAWAYDYNLRGHLTRVTRTEGAESWEREYKYNPEGEREERTDRHTDAGGQLIERTLSYDSYWGDTAAGEPARWLEVTEDASGAVLARYEYDDAGRLTHREYLCESDDTAGPDRILELDHSYDGFGRLTQIDLSDPQGPEYTHQREYRPNGTLARLGGWHVNYLGTSPISVSNDDYSQVQVFDPMPGGGWLSDGTAAAPQPMLTDPQGSYAAPGPTDPFGDVWPQTVELGPTACSQIINPIATDQAPTLGFHGHLNDPQTGIAYFGARNYLPELGQFDQLEPMMMQPTQPRSGYGYTYGLNNPLTFGDPSGNTPCAIAAGPAALAGYVAGAAIESGFILWDTARGRDTGDVFQRLGRLSTSALSGAALGATAAATCGSSLVVAAGAGGAVNAASGVVGRAVKGEEALNGSAVAFDATVGAIFGGLARAWAGSSFVKMGNAVREEAQRLASGAATSVKSSIDEVIDDAVTGTGKATKVPEAAPPTVSGPPRAPPGGGGGGGTGGRGGSTSGGGGPDIPILEPLHEVSPRRLVGRQTRTEMTGNKVKRLRKSFRKDGFNLQKSIDDPITAGKVDGQLIIIDGHHRAAAAAAERLSSVPVRLKDVSPTEAARLAREALEAMPR